MTEKKMSVTGNDSIATTVGLQAGSRPNTVVSNKGNAGLIGAIIVLILLAAGGGWFSYTKHVKDAEFLAEAETRIGSLNQEVTRFTREKSLMQTTLDALKERNEREKLNFAEQMAETNAKIKALDRDLMEQTEATQIAVATATNLRSEIVELGAIRSELETKLEQSQINLAASQQTPTRETTERETTASESAVPVPSDTRVSYAEQVRLCVKGGVSFPVPVRNSNVNPTALVRAYLTNQGLVSSLQLRESSGNNGFDAAVQRGVRSCAQFPLPSDNRYPSYIDIYYQMYGAEDRVQAPAKPPIPLEAQNYESCDDLGGCLSNMLMASYPLDRRVLERDASRINSLEQFARGDRKVARDFNQRGLQAFNNQDYRLAANLFRQGAQADPGDIELAANLAFALMRGGEIDAAGQSLATALILNPRRTATWTPLAEYFAQTDVFNYAVRSLLVGYYYSRNQGTTYRFYADKSQSEINAGLRRAYQAAFDVISAGTFGYAAPTQ